MPSKEDQLNSLISHLISEYRSLSLKTNTADLAREWFNKMIYYSKMQHSFRIYEDENIMEEFIVDLQEEIEKLNKLRDEMG